VTLICGFVVGKSKPGVVDVGLILPGWVVGLGNGFVVTWLGCIVNGWFIPFSSTQYFIVVVVGCNGVVVDNDVPVVEGAAVVDGIPNVVVTTVLNGAPVDVDCAEVVAGAPLVWESIVVVTSTQAMIPTVT